MSQEIEQNILKAISRDKIIPARKGYFIAKDYFSWIFFIASVCMAGLSGGIIFFLFLDYDWRLYKYLDANFFSFILLAVPYLWLAVLFVSVFFIFYFFGKTENGYKIEHGVIWLSGASVIILLGSWFWWNGTCQKVHQALAEISIYRVMVFDRNDEWNSLKWGSLTGTVINAESNVSFKIVDREGSVWQINASSLAIPGGVNIVNGQKIRLIGRLKEANTFLADMSRP